MSRRETSTSRPEIPRADRGSAVILALAVMMLIAAAGSALVLIAVTDTRISAFVTAGTDSFYGADAALERALVDLAALDRWDDALSGATVSTFTDGPGR